MPRYHHLLTTAEDFKGRRPNEAHMKFPRPTNNNQHPSNTHIRTVSMTIRQGHQRPVVVAAAAQADSRGESGGIQDGITDRAAESRRELSRL